MITLLMLRSASDDFGGIEHQILRIASGLRAAAGIEPILGTNQPEAAFPQAYAKLGLHVQFCPSLAGSSLAAAREIESLVDRHGVNLIQSHMFREALAARLVRMRRKDVRHVERIHTYIDCSWIPEWRKRAYHILAWLTQRGVDRYVPINHLAERELVSRTRISAGRISVVANGVERLGLPDAPCSDSSLPPRIAMVSNFVKHKGHDVLIRSLAELKHRGIVVAARLIGGEKTNHGLGSDSLTGRVRELAIQAGVLDQLEFFGFTQDLLQALSGISVVVLPSDREGLPNCLLEAMSVRKLIIASDAGGIPEIITHGENGLLHHVQDHQGLADILHRVFTTPACEWEDMRNRALETWRTRFSVEHMIGGLLDVYREMGLIQE